MIIRSEPPHADTHVDFVPMADVLFNLLIFFLLATSFHQVEREMHIALPEAAASGPISTLVRELVLNVDDAGRMYLGGREVGEDDVRRAITDALAANPDQKVTVRGDRAATYADVARALDLCKQSGIDQPYLDTVPVR